MINENINEENESEYGSITISRESKDMLISSRSQTSIDSEQEIREQLIHGKEALWKYRQKYISNQKIIQKCTMKGKISKDPLVQYLNEVENHCIFPKGMGLLHRKDNVHEINLDSVFMRDTYMNAFSKGIKVSEFIEDLTLRNVCLSTKRAITLIDSLAKEKIKVLDLSFNPLLNKHFYIQLADYLGDIKT